MALNQRLVLAFFILGVGVASCAATPVDASEALGPRLGIGAHHLRSLLQTNHDGNSNGRGDAAKITGALALYSLFGIFVFSSVSTCVISLIVTLQWPNPRACCYRTPHSDIPSSESCGCCALHRLNIGFAVTWLALLVLLVLALIIYLMAAAAVLAVVHAAIAYRLIRQLKASYAANAELQMTAALEMRTPPGLVTGVVVERLPPGAVIPGIPVINIPMTVATVDAPLLTQINFDEQVAVQNRAAAAAAAATAGSEGVSGAGESARRFSGRSATAAGASRRSRPSSPGGGDAGPSGSAGSSVGGSSPQAGKGSSVPSLPVAAVVDSRVFQQQQQQQQQQRLEQDLQQQQHQAGAYQQARQDGAQSPSQLQRGVFAWGAPGQSPAASALGDNALPGPPAVSASASASPRPQGDVGRPGPVAVEDVPTEPLIGSDLYPSSGPPGVAGPAAAGAGLASGAVGPGSERTSSARRRGQGQGPVPAAVEMPSLPGSPGAGWR